MQSGLAYNGMSKDGHAQWNRCNNVDPIAVEWPENPRSVSSGWNSSTNVWLKRCMSQRYLACGFSFI